MLRLVKLIGVGGRRSQSPAGARGNCPWCRCHRQHQRVPAPGGIHFSHLYALLRHKNNQKLINVLKLKFNELINMEKIYKKVEAQSISKQKKHIMCNRISSH
jgi:hypothetical protein